MIYKIFKNKNYLKKMKADYQQMETGGSDDIKKSTGITINFEPSHRRQNLLGNIQNNISGLMKNRINVEISPKNFIKQFKWIFIYMIVMLIIIIIFMKYYLVFGLINLILAVLGSVFLLHGVLKKVLVTYRMGTAFWILELLAIVIEIIIYILITFGQIFSGETSFLMGLIKFIGITVVLVAFLLVCAFFTYQIMKKKSDFLINYPNNNLSSNNMSNTSGRINYTSPIQTPGTIAKENK